MIESKCDICGVIVGPLGERFHQIENGYRCEECYADMAYNHPWLGWLFRYFARRQLRRGEKP